MPLFPLPGDGEDEGSGEEPGEPGEDPGPEDGEFERDGAVRLGLKEAVDMQSTPTSNRLDRRC
ncbi:hypothetical protein, partial [Mesorhizobium marinum]|uniref:hypothetical protein n=1 Tax=Mesorhizobium marinum TaxID=3228790 RepID=UPI003466819D